MQTRFHIAIMIAAAMGAVAVSAAPHGGHADHEMSDADHEMSDDDMDVVTVTGEVIDITCYVRHDSKGPEHIKCALYCANLGMPLGILEDDTDKIYLIIPAGHGAPQEGVDGFIGKHVTVKLMVFRRGGLNSAEVMEIAAVESKQG